MNPKKLMEEVRDLLEKRGKKACEEAEKEILSEEFEYEPIRKALQYFMKNLWRNFQHPALLSLSCESVGSEKKRITSLGAALALLTGGADIHDDVIDQSKTKGSLPTVFGKFGSELAILVGDALILKGFAVLRRACENLANEQGEAVMNLTKNAFFEIGVAEAKEVGFRGNWSLPAEEYLNIIRLKAAIADATAQIGAIVGGGTPDQIEALGNYGRNLGILATIRDEFIDIFEPDEIKNRFEKECLPLPILYAFTEKEVKKRIINILKKKELTEDDAYEIVEIVMKTDGVKALKRKINVFLENGITCLKYAKNQEVKNVLEKILYAMVEDL